MCPPNGCAVQDRQGQIFLPLLLHCVTVNTVAVRTEHATSLAYPLFAVTVTVFILMRGEIYCCIWGDDLWHITTGNCHFSLACGENRPKKLFDSTKSNASVLPSKLQFVRRNCELLPAVYPNAFVRYRVCSEAIRESRRSV